MANEWGRGAFEMRCWQHSGATGMVSGEILASADYLTLSQMLPNLGRE